MSDKASPPPGPIMAALLARQQRGRSANNDIERLEADLLADIEKFDIDAAQRQASRQDAQAPSPGVLTASIEFPEIVAEGVQSPHWKQPAAGDGAAPSSDLASNGLLAQLRQQAEVRLRETEQAEVARSAANEAMSAVLRQVFFYLHELVQQLNVVKPEVPRAYPLLDQIELAGLAWQEGFADYRSQAQSAGALIERVTLSYQLRGGQALTIERDSASMERFRTQLFDYGLQFSCEEFRNERRFVERALFQVQGQVSVSARWRADYASGRVVLETRNLERLGAISYPLRPAGINRALLDEFGRMVLGQPNRFRELVRRLAV